MKRSPVALVKWGILVILVALAILPAWRAVEWGGDTTAATLDIVRDVHQDFSNIGLIEMGNSAPLFANHVSASQTLGVYVLLTNGIEYNFVWYRMAQRLVLVSEGWVNQHVASGFSDASVFL